jgi:V/A-type H+/Na+-transporting ATPase subunit F
VIPEADVKFYCVGDEDTVRGFRLAGVEGRVVTSASEAAEAFNQAAARAEYGIILLTQPVGVWVRERVDAWRLGRDRPLLVEIPGPDGPLAGRKTLRQLVHSAVGMCVDQGKGA